MGELDPLHKVPFKKARNRVEKLRRVHFEGVSLVLPRKLVLHEVHRGLHK